MNEQPYVAGELSLDRNHFAVRERCGMSGAGTLRDVIDTAKVESGLTLGDLTVLAAQNDPYRYDTPAGHRNARWFVAQLPDGRRIHLRGLHYRIVAAGDVLKPNFRENADRWLYTGITRATDRVILAWRAKQ